MQSIQVSFLCVFVSENILKMEVLTLACLDLLYLFRLAYWAIPWWNSSWFTMTGGNSQQSKRKSEAIEKWHKHHLNAVNITGKKWNFITRKTTSVVNWRNCFAPSPKRECYEFQFETSVRFCGPLKILCLRNCNSSACQPDFFQIVIHVKHIRLMRKTFP